VPRRSSLGVAAIAISLLIPLGIAAPGGAAASPIGSPTILATLALSYGQLPENIALSAGGSVDVNFNGADELANISSTGTITPLGTLPKVPGGGTGTPRLKMPFSAGIVNNNGAIYSVFSTGLASLNGVYLTLPDGTTSRIAALPAGSLANGIAENFTTGTLYITDSALGKVWTVSAGGGIPTTWASGKLLEGVKGFGANGLKLHDGALYVSNTSLGTLVRIPILKNGEAGVAKVVAKNLPSIDDFAFIPGTNNLIAALNFANEVAYVQSNGTHSIILTVANGLENPSAVAISHSTVYITNADYYTLKGPSVMEAPLN
jgi:sugar lactone lactonase YvrE